MIIRISLVKQLNKKIKIKTSVAFKGMKHIAAGKNELEAVNPKNPKLHFQIVSTLLETTN